MVRFLVDQDIHMKFVSQWTDARRNERTMIAKLAKGRIELMIHILSREDQRSRIISHGRYAHSELEDEFVKLVKTKEDWRLRKFIYKSMVTV